MFHLKHLCSVANKSSWQLPERCPGLQNAWKAQRAAPGQLQMGTDLKATHSSHFFTTNRSFCKLSEKNKLF